MRHAAQTVEQAPVNSALLNVVTPMGLSFEKNRLSIGENIGKAYGIIRYPQKVDVEWLSKLTNIPSTLVSIGFKPVDNGTLINAISRSVVQQRGLADGAKDPLSRQRAEKAAEDGEKIIMQIDREGETVGLMSVEVMPVAREEKEFKKACRRAESVASVMKCKMRAIPNLQKEAFMHLSPTFPNHAKMESILQKVVPFSTFVGGFPFASSGFNDGEGYYFAKDTSGGLVIVDTWKRGGDRTNSNFCVMGNSGVGKSTAIKCIAGLLRFQGEVLIGPYRNKTLEAKRIFGYIPELPVMYDSLTVYEHLEFIGRAYGVKEWKQRADQLLERMELSDKVKKLGKELSKGMQQKVSICCALLPRPQVVLFDEPFVGLDPHAIKELKQMMLEMKRQGCAVVISTHMLNSVEELWDKTLIMMKGQIVASRTRREIEEYGENLEELFFSITEGEAPRVQEERG